VTIVGDGTKKSRRNMTSTDPQRDEPARGWLFYDQSCVSCTRWVRAMTPALSRRGYGIAALQSPGASERLGVSPGELLHEMRVIAPDGRVFGGADACIFIAGLFWWLWPLNRAARFSWVRRILHVMYRFIADRRTCATRREGRQ